MSDANHEARDWRFHVQDMIEFSERVLSYTNGLDQATFIADGRTYDATLRNLELVGEAATHIPRAVRDAHPENEEAWSTLRSDTSRPFDRPSSGRIAVKVINQLGDEVMKVFRV